MVTKKRAVSSQEQRRRAGKAAAQSHEDYDDGYEHDIHDNGSLKSSSSSRRLAYTVFRSTMNPKTYTSTIALEIIATAYCLFLINGRPSSLLNFNILLIPLCEDSVNSLLKSILSLLVVQLYFATQARQWLEHAIATDVPNIKKAQEEEEGDEHLDQNSIKESPTTDTGVKQLDQPASSPMTHNPRKHDLVTRISSTFSALLLSSLTIFVIAILLGAPLSRLLPETALLSAFMAILAFTAPLYMYGSPFTLNLNSVEAASIRATWARIFAAFRPRTDVEIAVVLPAYGTIIGAMIGVILEGLDWERPWQKWPGPCLVGSYVGWLIGQLASLAFCALMASAKGKGRWRL